MPTPSFTLSFFLLGRIIAIYHFDMPVRLISVYYSKNKYFLKDSHITSLFLHNIANLGRSGGMPSRKSLKIRPSKSESESVLAVFQWKIMTQILVYIFKI